MSTSRRPRPRLILSRLQRSAAAAGRPSAAVPVFVRCADPCRPGPGAPIAAQAPAAAQAATEYRDRSRSCPALVGSVGPRRAKVDRAKGSCRRFPSRPNRPPPTFSRTTRTGGPRGAGYAVADGTGPICTRNEDRRHPPMPSRIAPDGPGNASRAASGTTPQRPGRPREAA